MLTKNIQKQINQILTQASADAYNLYSDIVTESKLANPSDLEYLHGKINDIAAAYHEALELYQKHLHNT